MRYAMILLLTAGVVAIGGTSQAQPAPNQYQAKYVNSTGTANSASFFGKTAALLSSPFRMSSLFSNFGGRGANPPVTIPDSNDPHYLEYFGYKRHR